MLSHDNDVLIVDSPSAILKMERREDEPKFTAHVQRFFRRAPAYGYLGPGGAGSPSHNALRINYIINCQLSRDPLVVSSIHGVKSTVS